MDALCWCMCLFVSVYAFLSPLLPHHSALLQDSERVHHSPDLAFHNLSFIDKIGQGRFAAVWRAKNIEAEVAVKVFPNSPLSHDSWSRECEIYSTPELEHKYILSFRYTHM